MSNTTAKVINLADRRAKKEDEARNAPIPGWIVWLHCPKCNTLEYSEVPMPDGRVHKKCGTLVEEEEIQIDVRAEYTISMRNSNRLEELFKETKIPGFMKPLAKKGIGMLENLQAAESAIRDADIAEEVALLTRNQILVSASTAMVGQANLIPQSVLQLLG